MKNHSTKRYNLSVPWVESPFFYREFAKKSITDEEADLAFKFHRDGYIIIDLGLTDEFIKDLKKDIDMLNEEEDVVVQDKGYHYSKGKRIFEGWKRSVLIRQLALNERVLDILRVLYDREPYPFQTITFNYGSEQPLHSDTIHFDTIPHRWLAAAWVALEDVGKHNGSLKFVPKSHKLPPYDFQDLGLPMQHFGHQFEAYNIYEEFVEDLVEAHDLEVKTLECKAGQALIWASTLLHGGIPVEDKNSTRYSNVTHYYFEGCDKYYSPMFSNAQNGVFSLKDIYSKNIRDWKG